MGAAGGPGIGAGATGGGGGGGGGGRDARVISVVHVAIAPVATSSLIVAVPAVPFGLIPTKIRVVRRPSTNVAVHEIEGAGGSDVVQPKLFPSSSWSAPGVLKWLEARTVQTAWTSGVVIGGPW